MQTTVVDTRRLLADLEPAVTRRLTARWGVDACARCGSGDLDDDLCCRFCGAVTLTPRRFVAGHDPRA